MPLVQGRAAMEEEEAMVEPMVGPRPCEKSEMVICRCCGVPEHGWGAKEEGTISQRAEVDAIVTNKGGPYRCNDG